MSEAAHVPEGVVERLPVYLSALIQVRQEGHPTVSSARLGKMTGVNPAQIRRDLTYFGSFGRRGVGYEVVMLIDRIQRIGCCDPCFGASRRTSYGLLVGRVALVNSSDTRLWHSQSSQF
ncbi:MAG: hypothetical protein M1617_08495 [Actinobacteria bacterium]|nr:hypothetical protein [Actinomycetota bacterium]